MKTQKVLFGDVNKKMDFYHGTSIGGLHELKPFQSEHGKPYIYFSTNLVVAAFYTVHIVKRPNNWFPYGFDKNGLPCYTEYYENAMEDVYKSKSGYIYQCIEINNIENPTNINCAYVCEQPVPVCSVIKIKDMYEWFLEQEQNGKLRITRFRTLTETQRQFAKKMISEEIATWNLHNDPDSSYSKFISNRFPEIWDTK